MKMYELFSSENKWTQGVNAAKMVNYPDTQCSPFDPHAQCFCLDGAKMLCYLNSCKVIEAKLVEHFEARGMPKYEPGELGGLPNYIRWNDDPRRKWHEVRDLCKELNI